MKRKVHGTIAVAGLSLAVSVQAATSPTATSSHNFQRYEALTINSLVLGKVQHRAALNTAAGRRRVNWRTVASGPAGRAMPIFCISQGAPDARHIRPPFCTRVRRSEEE